MPSSAHISRAWSLLAVLLCLLYVSSWPGSVVRPPPKFVVPALPENVDRDGALDVFVREADADKVPVAGARVRAFAIVDGRAHAAADAITDASGRAALQRLPHVEHWIVAEAMGHARASQMVVIAPGGRRLDLALAAEHFLDIEIKTETGEPVDSAEIEVRGADPFPVGARSDAEGRVRVDRLSQGPFVVTVRAPGFEETTRRRVPEGTPCVFTLGRQGALLVRVVGETGEAVAGARVLIASASLWPARVAETKEDGSLRIGALEAGSYALRAVHDAHVSPVELGVQVARGEEKAVELRLAPGVNVTARVVDAAEDEGIGNARVTLVEGGLSPFPIEGLTDKSGRVVLGPIARGPSSLAARADGFVAKGAVRVDDPPPAEVKVALLKGGVLIGRIVDARGYAVDGASIRVFGTDLDGMPIDEDPRGALFREAHFSSALAGPRPMIPAGELGVMPGPVPAIPRGGLALAGAPVGATVPDEPWVSARDGTFRAAPIAPGRVRARIRHPQYVEAISDAVTIASETEARVDIVLFRGGSLEGTIVDTRGRPVAGAHVTVLATRGSLERVTRSGTDGSFAFAALPDAVTVLVSRDDDVSQVAVRLELAVPESGKKTVEIRLPEVRPALPVNVTTERGAPTEMAQISAVSLDPTEALRGTVFTDARGVAEIAGGKGVALRVEVKAPGRAAKIVTTTAETVALNVELAPAETVTGEVWANRREAIEGAEVTLQTDVGTRHARTNKDGAFVVADVMHGPALLRIRAKGRAPMERGLVVEQRAGRRPTEVGRVVLSEEGIVEGTVLDAKGNPVAGARVGKDAVPTYLPASGVPHNLTIADAKGRFRLGGLPEGTVTLEAYAPDFGRTRLGGVRVIAGRTTDGVKVLLARGESAKGEPLATGGVAVTLFETSAGLEAAEVVVFAVSEGSEAERAGLLPNDVIVDVGGTRVTSNQEARMRLSGPVHDDVVVHVRRGERTLTLRIPREQVRR